MKTELTPQQWLTSTLEKYSELDRTTLETALSFASSAVDLSPPPFATSTLAQGQAMATRLLELHCDSDTLAAALVYPCVYYHKIDTEKLQQSLGATVTKLVLGAKRMEALHLFHTSISQSQQEKLYSDNLRKMFLAMVDDVRAVLIKLAERIAIMQHLKYCDETQRKSVANQTMAVYAPLANRLGIGQFKWRLEDLSFRFLEPEEFKKISQALKMRREDRESYVQQMIARLTELFANANIENLKITGRAKHIYSIYNKMQRKHVDINEIYDSSAVRILVNSIKDCYSALGIVHATWQPIAKEFDDYIAKPKPNGYRSIHTAVVGPNNINVEIQIRTHKMHDEAELGVAAHWKYKEGGGAVKSTYEEKINMLREVMDWQKEISPKDSVVNEVFTQLFEDRIYIFTPKGDVFDLSAGSTPLDFAYHVHTDVGHHCKGARVNGVLVPLTHTLKTGDQVDIQTDKKGQPSRDWLNPALGYLKTSQARAKVRHWFKKQFYKEHLAQGEVIWEKAYRRANLKKSSLEDVVERLNYKTTEDLLAALGAGDIGISTVTHTIQAQQTGISKESEAAISRPASTQKSAEASSFTIEGVGNLLTQLARCCKPIPGDAIIGYITKGRGITIHQQDCRNIMQAIHFRPQRIIEVHWGTKTPQIFAVDINLHAQDRPGLIRDISNVLAKENIPLLSLNSRADKVHNQAFVNLTIEIKSLDPLQKILSQLRQIDDVIRVERR